MVLGVQFSAILGFTAAHAGWFWREHLGDDWPRVLEVPPISNVFERFGRDVKWSPRELLVAQGGPAPRLQFESSDSERMVQVQNTRFHYNWRKREGTYPSYEDCLLPFKSSWEKFIAFCQMAELGVPDPNQWEITYINDFPKDEMWSTASDWIWILPALGAPSFQSPCTSFEGLSLNYSGVWR